ARRSRFERFFQRIEPSRVQLVEPAPEHFLDEVVLGAEVVIHRGEIDVRRRSHLAQRRTGEAVPGEQRFGGAQDAFLGGKVRSVHKDRRFVLRNDGRRGGQTSV